MGARGTIQRRWRACERWIAIKGREAGYTDEQIAAVLKRPRGSVAAFFHRLKSPPPANHIPRLPTRFYEARP
jgi:hypothetical protein